MTTSPEQLAAAAKAHFEAQSAFITLLTSKTVEAMEKVIAVNVNAARSALGDAGAGKAFTDPQSLLAASQQAWTPNTEQALAYGRELGAIGESMQSDIAQAAEAQVAETRKRLAALVDEAVKEAPAGSEAAIALMQSILGNADAGYEKMMNESRKVAETLQSNVKTASSKLAAATDSALQAGKK